MFERYRSLRIAAVALSVSILVMAIGAVTWLALSEHNQQHLVNAAYQKNAEKDRSDAAEKVAQSCRDRNFISTRECIKTALESYYDEQSTDQDLQAQKDMAHWAKLVFWATVFTGLVGGAAVVYLAKDINVGRKLGRDQSRAYVHVSSAEFKWGNQHSSDPHFKIVITNSGATPAKWFQIRSGYGFVEDQGDGSDNRPYRFSELDLGEEFTGKWGGLPPSDGGRSLRAPEIDEVEEFKSRVLSWTKKDDHRPDCGVMIFGEVKYCTAFDEIFISQFFFGQNLIYQRTEDDAPTAGARKEVGQKLSQFPIESDLYKPQGQN